METNFTVDHFLAYLELCRHRYEKELDALSVWEAIKWCCQVDYPFPDWIKEYLLSASEKLLEIEVDKQENKPWDKVIKKIKYAIKIDNISIFSRHKKFILKAKVYEEVNKERKLLREKNINIDKPGTDVNLYENVAERLGIGVHAVKKYYTAAKRVGDSMKSFQKELGNNINSNLPSK
jgi:hypothetical protein